MIEVDKLYTQADLMPVLRKSKNWFERKRWDGSGPRYLKIGRSVLYRGEDVLSWLDEQARTSTSDRGGE
jgi:predicted DNA-binding transcriptional regulator AlpA